MAGGGGGDVFVKVVGRGEGGVAVVVVDVIVEEEEEIRKMKRNKLKVKRRKLRARRKIRLFCVHNCFRYVVEFSIDQIQNGGQFDSISAFNETRSDRFGKRPCSNASDGMDELAKIWL
jgi:hypothetical protein